MVSHHTWHCINSKKHCLPLHLALSVEEDEERGLKREPKVLARPRTSYFTMHITRWLQSPVKKKISSWLVPRLVPVEGESVRPH